MCIFIVKKRFLNLYIKLTPVSYEYRTEEISNWTTDNVIEWLSIINNEHTNILTPPIDDYSSPTWITDEQSIWNSIQSKFKKHKINGQKLLQLTDNSLLNAMKIDIEDIRYKILFERRRLFNNNCRRSKTNVELNVRLKNRLFDSDNDSYYSQNIMVDNNSQHTYTQSQSQCRILIGTPPPPPPLVSTHLHFDELLIFYEMIDKNNDGHVCYSDWTSIMIELASNFDFILSENDIMSTFDEFDLNGNGIISREEFIAVMAKVYLRSKTETKICNYFTSVINHLMRKNGHRRNSSKLKNRYIKKHDFFHPKLNIKQNSCRIKGRNGQRNNNRNSSRNKKLRRHYTSVSNTNNNSPSLSLSSSFSRSGSCSHSRSRATPVPPPRNSDINQKNYRFKKRISSKPKPPPRYKSASNA